jgi:hypothetical protein
MGIDRLHVIDSGADPSWGQPGQRDDGSNVLAIGRRVAVSHERNSETNARLEAAGVRVISVPSSELGSLRGGPRCMTCPITREPAARALELTPDLDGRAWTRARARPTALPEVSVPGSRLGGPPDSADMPPVLAPAASVVSTPAERDHAGGDHAEGDHAEGDHAERDQAELASASRPA